jgi:Sec-independent protein translocase protein TatA
LIIALIVVGPEKLPQLAQSIGKTLRDLRAMSQVFTTGWQQEIGSAAGVESGEDLQRVLTQPIKEAQTELQQALTAPETLAQPLKEAQADLQEALTAPLTSPSQKTASSTPAESPSPEQPDTLDADTDHADT